MLLNCFENFGSAKSFFKTVFVFKETQQKGLGEASGELAEAPEETADAKKLRKELKEAVGVTMLEKAEEVKSHVEDILKTSDKLEWFVEKHGVYARKTARKWNQEFCHEVLDLKGKVNTSEAMVYVMALQMFLNDRLKGTFGPGIKNKFTLVDGYLGGYTVSVLLAHLRQENKGNAKWEKKWGKLTFAKSKRSKKEFGKAIKHLKKQLKEKVVPLTDEEHQAKIHCNRGKVFFGQGDLKSAKEQYEKAIKLDPNYVEAYIYLGNVFFDQGDLESAKEQYDHAIKISPKNAIALHSMAILLEKQGEVKLADDYYKKAGKIEPMLALGEKKEKKKPAPPTPSKAEGKKVAKKPVAPAKAPEGRPEELTEEQKNQADALAKTTVFSDSDLELFSRERRRKTEKEEFDELRDAEGGKPEFGVLERNVFIDKAIEGNWVYRAFDEYKKAYEKYKKDPIQKNKHAYIKLFDRLGKAIDDYYNQVEKIVNKLKEKYEPSVRVLVGTYDLPEEVDVRSLPPKAWVDDESYSKYASQEENYQYTKQKKKILSEDLREPKAIDSFYKDYFKKEFRPPKRIFKNWDILAQQLISPEDLEKRFSGVEHFNITNRVNEIIRLRNMHFIYEESKILKKEFNKGLKDASRKLNISYENYYRDYKGKEEKDFVADLLEGRVLA